jgi:hypothetical protein
MTSLRPRSEEQQIDAEQPRHTSGASSLGPAARAAVFQALRPALEALAREATADPRLSDEARRVLRAVARTGPGNTLALADLAARSSTPKARVPAALTELEDSDYLARLARIAPHLVAALPAPPAPAPDSLRSIGVATTTDPSSRHPGASPPAQSTGDLPSESGLDEAPHIPENGR